MKKEIEEAIDKQIEVLKAFKEGKVIECKSKYDRDDPWEALKNPSWNWLDFDYRVQSEPVIRPYKTEEFLAAMRNHGPMIKFAENQYLSVIDFEIISVSLKGDKTIKLEDLIQYTWQDGTPCGIKQTI